MTCKARQCPEQSNPTARGPPQAFLAPRQPKRRRTDKSESNITSQAFSGALLKSPPKNLGQTASVRRDPRKATLKKAGRTVQFALRLILPHFSLCSVIIV